MRKKSIVSLLTIPLVAVIASGCMYINKTNTVSIQSDVINAANKATQNEVECIKETLEDGSYTVRYRDRGNLNEVTEEYRDNKLQNKLIIEDRGKKITSYGRDFESGKLVGYTWTMPENIAAENEKLLQSSLLEKVKEEMKSKSWTAFETNDIKLLTAKATNEQKAVSENDHHKEIITIDLNTGLPTQRVIYEKNKNGTIVDSSTKIEEYKFIDSDSMAKQIKDFAPEESIEIKEIPAPIVKDKLFEGS